MGTPGPTPTPTPQAQVEEKVEEKVETPRWLTVNELDLEIKKAIKELNSGDVEPKFMLKQMSVNGGKVVFEVWLAHEFKNIEVLSEIVSNQVCEGLDIPVQLCANTRSKARDLVLEVLRQHYSGESIAVVKVNSSRGRFSVTWTPLPPTQDPVNGGYYVGNRITVVVELPVFEGIGKEVYWVLGRLEEMLYNVY
jgi:hypothetical protein